jgi:hypothetical protein
MADNVRMALAEPSVQTGAGRGTASLPARPRGREGAPSPAGAERAGERSRSRSGLDGERVRGRLSDWGAVPVAYSNFLTRTASAWFFFGCQDRKENYNKWLRV